MSWRLWAAVALCRAFARPHLARTPGPAEAEAEFARGARLGLRRPPYLRHLVRRRGETELHWIGSGPARADALILYVHGGAFVSGSPETHEGMLGRLSRLTRVEVCAPRYPLLQEARFPAGPVALLRAWDEVLRLGHEPSRIVLGGDSAGGGLALGLLAALLARGERPAGLFAFSPWTDLTLSGESLVRLGPRDPLLPVERMAEVRDLYLAGADPADPRASPLFADYGRPPPVLIQVGAEEALIDDSRRMAARLQAAGGTVTLEEWPGCPHVWQMLDGWVPEARAALRRVAGFVQASLPGDRR